MGHICQILVINAQVCFVMVHIAPHVLDFYFTLRLYAIEIRRTVTVTYFKIIKYIFNMQKLQTFTLFIYWTEYIILHIYQ